MKNWDPKIQEALGLMRTGATSREAGARLGINPTTIRAYLFKHPEEREGMPVKQGRPGGVDPKIHEALVLMRSGVSSREAANRVGVAAETIRSYLWRHPEERQGILPQGGTSFAKPKEPAPAKTRVVPATILAVLERVRLGMTYREASQAEGISHETVKSFLRRYPEMRPAGPEAKDNKKG